MKKIFSVMLFLAVISLSTNAVASDNYRISGKSGIVYFVAVSPAQKNNEDVYRQAVGEVCAGKAICQVQFWVGDAPGKFPISNAQANSKLVHWQQNLNTGLRRWLVNCNSSKLFSSERECM